MNAPVAILSSGQNAASNPGRITLTRSNLETGALTSEQLSGFSGYPVIVQKLSRLPHWKFIQDRTIPDSQLDQYREFNERRDAVYQLLETAGITVNQGGTFTKDDASAFAAAQFSIIRNSSYTVNLPAGLSGYFHDTMERGVDTVIDDVQTAYFGEKPGLTLPWEFPGALEDIPIGVRTKNGSTREQIFKQCAAVMLVNGDDDDIAETWAFELSLPVGCAQKIPDPNIHRLIAKLHEAAHLIQIRFWSTHDFNDYIAAFGEEAHADLFAHSLLRRTAKLPEFADFKDGIEAGLIMDRHKRYMGFLSTPPQYWTAPRMDALETGEKPPSFYSIHQSVMEIRLRLLAEADKLQREREGLPSPLPIHSSELNNVVASWRQYPGANSYYEPTTPKQIAGIDLTSHRMLKSADGSLQGLDNLYLEWQVQQLRRNPEVFYTLLKNSLDQGLFDGNGFTRKLAARMVQAAEYFNPALTRAQNVKALVNIPGGVTPGIYGNGHAPIPQGHNLRSPLGQLAA